MSNDFEKMNKMSKDNKDIKCVNASNIKRYQTGKNGWGEITIAVDNTTILNLEKYMFVAYFVNAEQFKELED